MLWLETPERGFCPHACLLRALLGLLPTTHEASRRPLCVSRHSHGSHVSQGPPPPLEGSLLPSWLQLPAPIRLSSTLLSPVSESWTPVRSNQGCRSQVRGGRGWNRTAQEWPLPSALPTVSLLTPRGHPTQPPEGRDPRAPHTRIAEDWQRMGGSGRDEGCRGAHALPTVHWASAAAICWMSSTVLTRSETRVSVTFLRIWACSCRRASSSAAVPRVCSDCGYRAQGAECATRAPAAARAGARRLGHLGTGGQLKSRFFGSKRGLSQGSSDRRWAQG